jgi:hypothetical protein
MACKIIRNNLVDFGERILRSTGLSDKIICGLLRFLHFGISIFTGYLLLFGSKWWFMLVILINIIVFASFYIFKGCILSKLEHRFTKDDFTVIDPFLMVIGVELTNNNRYKYSIISNIFACVLTVGLYCVRFGGAGMCDDLWEYMRQPMRVCATTYEGMCDNLWGYVRQPMRVCATTYNA